MDGNKIITGDIKRSKYFKNKFLLHYYMIDNITSQKIRILLEDDNEVLGTGLGHSMYRQYLPTKKYINILNKYNAKSTFYIDWF